MMNRLVEIDLFGGTLSVALATPEAQRRVTGNPVNLGLTLNVHVWANRTFAAAVTLPPRALTGEGVTLNDVILGKAAGRTDPATAEVVPSSARDEPRQAMPSRTSDILTALTIPP